MKYLNLQVNLVENSDSKLSISKHIEETTSTNNKDSQKLTKHNKNPNPKYFRTICPQLSQKFLVSTHFRKAALGDRPADPLPLPWASENSSSVMEDEPPQSVDRPQRRHAEGCSTLGMSQNIMDWSQGTGDHTILMRHLSLGMCS